MRRASSDPACYPLGGVVVIVHARSGNAAAAKHEQADTNNGCQAPHDGLVKTDGRTNTQEGNGDIGLYRQRGNTRDVLAMLVAGLSGVARCEKTGRKAKARLGMRSLAVLF
jgi:hypothetical protein